LGGTGKLGDNFAVVGATLNVTGGTIGIGLETIDATINVIGGSVEQRLVALSSNVNVSGGTICSGDCSSPSLNAFAGTNINMTGGTIWRQVPRPKRSYPVSPGLNVSGRINGELSSSWCTSF
jgi:hypothetical protein